MNLRICVFVSVLLSAGMAASAATHDVDIVNFSFSPATLTISVADSVRWSQVDATSHTSTSGQNGIPNGLWDSGFLSPGQQFTHVFNTAGNFPYFCRPHTFMTGSITVAGGANQPPVVSITQPANNASFPGPTNLIIQASASDPDGSITQVQFFDGSTSLGVDTSAPYSVTNNFAVGSRVLTAVATDNAGAPTTSAAVNITITAPNQPPAVSITSPANNASFSGPTNLTIEADASDPDGSITQVQFFDGSSSLGADNNAPYSVTNNFSVGTHVLTVVATDNAGTMTPSASVTITVTAPNQPPLVSITQPMNNASFSGPTNLAIEASASDADGSVTQIQFFDGATALGVDNSAPYSVTNSLPVGSRVLIAVATDNAGAMSTSAPVNITITAANQLPTVSITSPTNNTSFLGPTNLLIEATASDPDGSIFQVQFFNGTNSLGMDSAAPFSADASLSFGTHVLIAVATDNAGTMSTSAPVNITVVAPNQLPIVAITQPTNNASFLGPTNLTIAADAGDPDGSITRVEFFDGSAALGADNDAPYSINANLAFGSHALTAIATDNAGVAATSAPVNITIRSAPVVITKSILNGANLELAWSGGIGPFTVQQKLSLTESQWTNIVATASRNASIPAAERTAFFRVADTASQPPALFRATRE